MDLDVAFRKPPAHLWLPGYPVYYQVELNGFVVFLEVILQAPGNLFTALEDVLIKVCAIPTLSEEALLSVICQIIYVPRGRRLRLVHGYECISNLVKDLELEHPETQFLFSDFSKHLIDPNGAVTPLTNQVIELVPRDLIHLVLFVIVYLLTVFGT